MSTQRTLLAGMFARKARGLCPFCGKSGPFEFRDALSRKEFGLSGLCQPCQDGFFTEAPPPGPKQDAQNAYVVEHDEFHDPDPTGENPVTAARAFAGIDDDLEEL